MHDKQILKSHVQVMVLNARGQYRMMLPEMLRAKAAIRYT